VVVRIKFKLKAPRNAPRRSFSAVAACLAVCASSTADMPPAPPTRAVASYTQPAESYIKAERIQKVAPDPRAAYLERFFHRYHCPAPYHVVEYLRAADDYQLDYRLLPAISVRETQCGVTETENNRWGFRNGQHSFPSVEEGIEFMAHRLAGHVYYRGKTLQQKLFT
jgi:hypothetical protein